jgi:hypothetical protein
MLAPLGFCTTLKTAPKLAPGGPNLNDRSKQWLQLCGPQFELNTISPLAEAKLLEGSMVDARLGKARTVSGSG